MDSKVLTNFIWRFLERWAAQGVSLIVSIVLARRLGPEVFGTIALINVFITIFQVFVDSGLGVALIQKKDADNTDFSSVFWFNIINCAFLYLIMYGCAPAIARFYNRPEIVPVIRVLSLILIISGVKNVEQAYISKKLLFKKFFFATLGGTLVSAAVGIIMAYRGFEIWALVSQYLVNALIDTIILWFTIEWRPKWAFSVEKFKDLFSFGWKMLASGLIDTIYNELRALIIGKFYSGSDLAFYTKGSQFPKYAVDNINSSLNSVLLPVLSQKQDDIKAVKVAARRVIRASSFAIWPMMIGLAVVSEKFIVLLLTEKWLPAKFYMQIICFGCALQPLQTTNLSVIKSLGRSDLHLKLEAIKKTIAIVIVIISAFWGVKAIAVGALIYAVIAAFINAFPNKNLIKYGYFEQIKDVFPYAMLSVVMGAVVFMVGKIPLQIMLSFLLQILTGIIAYYLLCKIFMRAELDSMKKIVGSVFK